MTKRTVVSCYRPVRRVVLRAILEKGGDRESVCVLARAEHLAARPEDADCEFEYIVRVIVDPPEELQERAPFQHLPQRLQHSGLVTWDDLTITLDDGRVVSGSYGYSDRNVTVKTALGSKTTHIGSTHPRSLAPHYAARTGGRGKGLVRTWGLTGSNFFPS